MRRRRKQSGDVGSIWLHNRRSCRVCVLAIDVLTLINPSNPAVMHHAPPAPVCLFPGLFPDVLIPRILRRRGSERRAIAATPSHVIAFLSPPSFPTSYALIRRHTHTHIQRFTARDTRTREPREFYPLLILCVDPLRGRDFL